MKKTLIISKALAVLFLAAVSTETLSAQNNKENTNHSSPNLPAIQKTSDLGVFYSDFSESSLSESTLISSLGKWLGGGKYDTFKVEKTWKDELGIKKTIYQHFYKDIKVQSDIIVVHERDGKVLSVNGEFVKIDQIFIHNPVSSQELKNIIASDNRTESENLTLSIIENVISKKIDSGKLQLNNSTMVSAYSSVKPIFSKIYYIDNITKQIFNSNTLIHSDHIGNIDSDKLIHTYNCNLNLVPQKSQFSLLIDTPGTSTTYYKGNQPVVVDSNNGEYRLKHNARKVWTMDATNWGTTTGWAVTNDGYVVRTTGSGSSAIPYIAEYSNTIPNYTANGTKAAVEVHWSIQKSNDYYSDIHNRNNFDGNGTPIACYYNVDFSTINTGVPAGYGANATAITLAGGNNNYYAMAFGNGQGTSLSLNPFVGIDVGGHEYSHLVVTTNGTGGLTYQGESGALNEAFADILGTSIEFYSAPAQANWTIGEGLTNFAPGFLRSMSNPETSPPSLNGGAPQPNIYGGANWAPTGANAPDNGGVHINSGVANKWFYLLSAGGTHNNKTVTGLTIQKAEKIAYKTLTGGYLTNNSNFVAVYNASKQAAVVLYGAGSNEVQQVENAWCAVGVGNCLTLAVDESSLFQSENIKTYPNPVTNGQFTIDYVMKGNAEYEIYDLSGKLVSTKQKLERGKNNVTLSGVDAGVYLVKISGEGTSVTKKIIVK
jgi:bacillolysin